MSGRPFDGYVVFDNYAAADAAAEALEQHGIRLELHPEIVYFADSNDLCGTIFGESNLPELELCRLITQIVDPFGLAYEVGYVRPRPDGSSDLGSDPGPWLQ
jgi:hypothetical protein